MILLKPKEKKYSFQIDFRIQRILKMEKDKQHYVVKSNLIWVI